MNLERDELRDAINSLVDEYRDTCLWFLRPDYYPTTLEQRMRVLNYIDRYGDRAAYLKAADARRWLSHSSNAKSAAS